MNWLNFKKILKEFSDQSKEIAGYYKWGGNIHTIGSMLYCLLRYGARPIDYVRFEFHKKSAAERNRYMTFLRYFKIIKRIDKKTFAEISANKSRELQLFKKFIHRDWILVDETTEQKVLDDFLDSHNSLIAKPEHGEQGKGIFKIVTDSDRAKLNEQRLETPFIVEEIVHNADYIRVLNPSSLNTVRATTFVDRSGKINIISIILRVGAPNSHVDNWGAGGVGYNFDIDTGICNCPGKDKRNRQYLLHPGSNIKMIGFELQNFSALKEFIISLASTMPSAKYVGWDIAITPIGFELIEMNCPAGHDMFQSFDNPVYSYFTKNW